MLFITVSELLSLLRDQCFTEKLSLYELEKFFGVTVRYLFLDDIGAEKTTDWALEKLYNIINMRYNNNLHITVTSNLELDELSKKTDDRIVSRLNEMCELIRLSGEDRRVEVYEDNKTR